MDSPLTPRATNRMLGIVLGALALYSAASLALPGGWHATGPLGDGLHDGLRAALGSVSAWILPLLLAAWGVNRLRESPVLLMAIRSLVLVTASLLVATGLGLFGRVVSPPLDPLALDGVQRLVVPPAHQWGGALGGAFAQALLDSVGPLGAHIGVWTLATILIVLAIEISWPRPVVAASRGAKTGGLYALGLSGTALAAAWDAFQTWREERAERKAANAKAAAKAAKEAAKTARQQAKAAKAAGTGVIVVDGARGAAAEDDDEFDEEDEDELLEEDEYEDEEPEDDEEEYAAAQRAPRKAAPKPRAAAQTTFADHAMPVRATKSVGPEDMPPTTLLLCSPSAEITVDEDEMRANGTLLEQRLRDFGVEGTVKGWEPGPVITTYEIEPAPGVRVSSFVGRADDIALAMRVGRVRIFAPIPGRGAVGVEVPNRTPQMVRLGDIVQAPEFLGAKAALPLPLGLNTSGHPVSADLAKMPHLLVAGATGAGKSTCINTILAGLLLRRRPSELRLVLVDPKMLELSAYQGVPHLLMPVVTEIKKEAPKALMWLVQEMEDRYRLLAARGARNIDSYNSSLRKDEEQLPLPYIVVVVDELADLMLVAGRDVEDSIARLAQMARAVGIHLILATQRPSVDVITGVIKANFPSRIAFQVASKVDSRTILDVNGAEALLGKGDMLFLQSGRGDPLRVHGAYISEEETDALVAWLREHVAAPPTIDLDAALRSAQAGGDGAMGEANDELFEEAARLVLTHRLGSTSFLQRRLKVGYSRAGRLMDLLEEYGVVGPGDGSKPREVLLELDEWEGRRAAVHALDEPD